MPQAGEGRVAVNLDRNTIGSNAREVMLTFFFVYIQESLKKTKH